MIIELLDKQRKYVNPEHRVNWDRADYGTDWWHDREARQWIKAYWFNAGMGGETYCVHEVFDI